MDDEQMQPFHPLINKFNEFNDLNIKYPGIDNAYQYESIALSMFGIHTEDLHLAAYNYHYAGDTKHWQILNETNTRKLSTILKNLVCMLSFFLYSL